MKVHLKIRSLDLGLSPSGSTIDVPDGATVEQAINSYLAADGRHLTNEQLRQSVILVNKTAARPEHVLQPEDELMLLQSLEGG